MFLFIAPLRNRLVLLWSYFLKGNRWKAVIWIQSELFNEQDLDPKTYNYWSRAESIKNSIWFGVGFIKDIGEHQLRDIKAEKGFCHDQSMGGSLSTLILFTCQPDVGDDVIKSRLLQFKGSNIK